MPRSVVTGVTRRLVEALGGEVSVLSEPGQGSRFTVWLPVGARAPELSYTLP